ncbi:recombinase family protein [Streptomyces olivoreticuli]
MTEKKRVAIYCKISGHSDEDASKSLAYQTQKCGDWASANGMIVTKVLTDMDERPAHEVLREAVASGEYEALIAIKRETYDRKARQLFELLWFAEDQGVQVYEVEHGIDLTADEKTDALQFMMEFTEMESERARAEAEQLAQQGLVLVEMELPKELLKSIPKALKSMEDSDPIAHVLQAVLDGAATPE